MNVFWWSDHCNQWFFNGFWSCYHRFQWFSMVLDHWSNDAMVSMDRCGLPVTMKLLMTMMIHQLSVTSNKVSSQLISPQNWPVFIFPLTQSEPDIYHLNSNQSLKKFPVVLTCTYFSFYLSSGPRGIFYYLESIT